MLRGIPTGSARSVPAWNARVPAETEPRMLVILRLLAPCPGSDSPPLLAACGHLTASTCAARPRLGLAACRPAP